MKKEVDILNIFTKSRKIGLSKSESEIVLTILDCGAVIETDFIACINEVYFNEKEEDAVSIKVRGFLAERGLKLFNITLECGTRLNNCIMRADKPLKSFFDLMCRLEQKKNRSEYWKDWYWNKGGREKVQVKRYIREYEREKQKRSQ